MRRKAILTKEKKERIIYLYKLGHDESYIASKVCFPKTRVMLVIRNYKKLEKSGALDRPPFEAKIPDYSKENITREILSNEMPVREARYNSSSVLAGCAEHDA